MTHPNIEPAASRTRPRFQWDQQDLDLVDLVEEFLHKGASPERLRKLFNTNLHPRGIKELAASPERRLAYAVIRLLDSLDTGLAQDRLVALAALHDELLERGDSVNTARVLLEIMKHLVRERGNYWKQVELAHEFFSAASGRPRVIRRNLAEYHLLEMAEQWTQVAFDHHVHDANTKGRKAPTHLVVDAWIKGIRDMTVVYYYCTSPEAISELVGAADIMSVSVKPGIEVAARHRGKYVQFIWVPHGLQHARDYLEFFAKPPMAAFFDEGRAVIRYQTAYVLDLLEAFNRDHRPQLNTECGVELPVLGRDKFLHFVGVGQPSRSHLSEYIHGELMQLVTSRLPTWREDYQRGSGEQRRTLDANLARLEKLTADEIAQTYLAGRANPNLADVHVPQDDACVPALLRSTPREMSARLKELRDGSEVTLNPSNLTAADVLEILYDCKGAITHIEIFNLKDRRRNRNPHIRTIGRLRQVINSGNSIVCKRMIQEIIHEVEGSDEPAAEKRERLGKLHQILGDIEGLFSFYAEAHLGSRLGSDSTGRARTWSGMGLAVMPTLLPRALHQFRQSPSTREVIPVAAQTVLRTTWVEKSSDIWVLNMGFRLLRKIPGLREFGCEREDAYEVVPNTTAMADQGNILTLGGVPERGGNNLSLAEPVKSISSPPLHWRFLNSHLKNILKVAIGFIPAFLTFYLTKDWWVLAYFGAFIWFGITGLRNIIQAILGGAGIARSELLRWQNLVSWGRVADSLLYTGFSVPLLDWVVKSIILSKGFAVTTTTAPLILYTVVAVANGTYLFSHNVFRGLPRSAALGNFFRSVLSIPLAFGLNVLALKIMQAAGTDTAVANAMLQNWATVIAKLASDVVAGFIEGTADRSLNMRRRNKDYRSKLARLIAVHGRLEALFPEIEVVDALSSPKEFFRTLGKEALELEQQQIVNALDLMHFWMHQPRARVIFERHLAAATIEERRIILRTQRLLERKRPISKMFLDDLVGKNFSPPLAFYLDRSDAYLHDMRALGTKYDVDWNGKPSET